VTIGFHWVTVALVAAMFGSAWLHEASANLAQANLVLEIHRSLGVTLWFVALWRLGWRTRFAFLPPFPPTMSKVQQTLAMGTEYGLYALLLAQPATGLIQSFTRGRAFPLFGWEAPVVMAKDSGLTILFHTVHAFSAWTLLGLISLHVIAALFHRFVLRDEVLQSMLPWRASVRPSESSESEAEMPRASRSF
jgi:cytochrome b561